MGTRVSYKPTRSGAGQGAEITNPTEYFSALFEDETFITYQEAFNALPADKQAEFLALFGGAVNMEDTSSGK